MTVQNTVFDVTDRDFEEQVLKSELPVIVDFTAEWCPPCRALAPIYEQLSQEYEGTLRFARIDVDENVETPGRLYVYGFPTLLMFHNGKEIKRLVGPHPVRLKRLVEQALAENGIVGSGAKSLSW